MNEETEGKTISKTVRKYGNSGGIYLPASWIGGMAEAKLVSMPANPEKDIPAEFSGHMKHVISAFVYGSYARGEHAPGSDIDVVLVTDEHAGSIKPGSLKSKKYDITVLERGEAIKAAKNDPLFRKSLDEAMAIVNDSFLDYLKSLKTSRDGLAERIGLAESSLSIIKSIADAGYGPELIYPLVMRIKEAVLFRCIFNGKDYSLKLLERIIRSKGISKKEYDDIMMYYRQIRGSQNPKKAAFKDRTYAMLIELLGELIADAKQKEKAGKRR